MKVLLTTKKHPYEPLGVAYLAAMLEQRGHDVTYATNNDALSTFDNIEPEVVGFGTVTGSHKDALNLALQIKAFNPDVFTVFGGPHPTFFPQIFHENGVDSVIMGEAEHSICDFVEKQQPKCEIGRLEPDLDKLPFPSREFIYSGMPEQRNNPILHIAGSRGCPFSCPYCYNSGFKELYKGKQTVRYRSPQNIVQEIKEASVDRPVQFIHFQDDAFTANKAWLYCFLREYEREVKLPFHAIVRLDQLTDDVVGEMKEAGLHSVRTAVESGNIYLREGILERKMSESQIREGCNLLHKYGIEFLLQNMLGLPEGDLAMDMETLMLNKQLRPTYAWASLFQPYPGTKLGDKHKGKLEDINESFYDSTPLKIPDRQERIKLRRNFASLVNGRTMQEADKLLYKGVI
jgi:radical SAM superfamily enzyme YgiQ (UPF0313 family)